MSACSCYYIQQQGHSKHEASRNKPHDVEIRRESGDNSGTFWVWYEDSDLLEDLLALFMKRKPHDKCFPVLRIIKPQSLSSLIL